MVENGQNSILGEGTELFLFATTSRPAVRHSQCRKQRLRAVLSKGVQKSGRHSDH
jgi:hypothetical protein